MPTLPSSDFPTRHALALTNPPPTILLCPLPPLSHLPRLSLSCLRIPPQAAPTAHFLAYSRLPDPHLTGHRLPYPALIIPTRPDTTCHASLALPHSDDYPTYPKPTRPASTTPAVPSHVMP